MTSLTDQRKRFDEAFVRFERLRIYPAGYKKEKKMVKPQRKHISAIIRNLQLLKHGLKSNVDRDFAKQIETDMVLMAEIKDMLFEIMANPVLPFAIAHPDDVEPLLDEIGKAPKQDW